jgi:hypothetical protein
MYRGLLALLIISVLGGSGCTNQAMQKTQPYYVSADYQNLKATPLDINLR